MSLFFGWIFTSQGWQLLGRSEKRVLMHTLVSSRLDELRLPESHGVVTQHGQPPLFTPTSLPPRKAVSPTSRGASTNKTTAWEAAKRRRR